MANVVVIRAEPSPPPIDRVVLTLTEKEALIVRALAGRLTGTDRDAGFRKASDSVYHALDEALGEPDELPGAELAGGVTIKQF